MRPTLDRHWRSALKALYGPSIRPLVEEADTWEVEAKPPGFWIGFRHSVVAQTAGPHVVAQALWRDVVDVAIDLRRHGRFDATQFPVAAEDIPAVMARRLAKKDPARVEAARAANDESVLGSLESRKACECPPCESERANPARVPIDQVATLVSGGAGRKGSAADAHVRLVRQAGVDRANVEVMQELWAGKAPAATRSALLHGLAAGALFHPDVDAWLPAVLLEALAAGGPAVPAATWACRRLLYASDDPERWVEPLAAALDAARADSAVALATCLAESGARGRFLDQALEAIDHAAARDAKRRRSFEECRTYLTR